MEQRLPVLGHGNETSGLWQQGRGGPAVPGGEMQLLIRNGAFGSGLGAKWQLLPLGLAQAAAAASLCWALGFAVCVEWRKVDQNRG